MTRRWVVFALAALAVLAFFVQGAVTDSKPSPSTWTSGNGDLIEVTP